MNEGRVSRHFIRVHPQTARIHPIMGFCQFWQFDNGTFSRIADYTIPNGQTQKSRNNARLLVVIRCW